MAGYFMIHVVAFIATYALQMNPLRVLSTAGPAQADSVGNNCLGSMSQRVDRTDNQTNSAIFFHKAPIATSSALACQHTLIVAARLFKTKKSLTAR